MRRNKKSMSVGQQVESRNLGFVAAQFDEHGNYIGGANETR